MISSLLLTVSPSVNWPRHLIRWLLVLSLLTATCAFAQSDGPKKDRPDTPGSPDVEWSSLKNLGKAKTLVLPAKADAVAIEQARSQAVSSYLTDADALRQFYTRSPNHAAAKEAKRLEALALVQASVLGDTSQSKRRDALVGEIRKDKSLPVAARAEVAAFADNIEVGKRRNLSREARLLAYEQVARSLVGEFSELPDTYAALVQIAKDSPDARARALAQEVLGLSAPAWVKAEAQTILDRYALLGQSLPALAAPILGNGNAIEQARGKPIVLYSWARASAGSVLLAKDLAAKAPAGAAILGVCLDQRDVAPAQAFAVAENLPGTQFYDWLGTRGELALALKLTDAGLVYLADRKGELRSVSAQQDLAAALSRLGTP